MRRHWGLIAAAIGFLSACTTRFEANLGPDTRLSWGITPSPSATAYRRDLPLTPFPTRAPIPTLPAGASANLAAIEAEIMAIYAQSMPAVVSIEAAFTHPTVDGAPSHPIMLAQGSGFVADDQGHIVTNAHVVADADRYAVRFSEASVISATVIARDPAQDIAVLALDRIPPVAPLSLSTRTPAPGMWVMAIGNPYGLRESMTLGTISAVDRAVPADSGTLSGMLQVDAALNPGNSGGVLVDRTGAVVGMTTAIQSMTGSFTGIGYAIPAATLATQIAMLLADTQTNPLSP